MEVKKLREEPQRQVWKVSNAGSDAILMFSGKGNLSGGHSHNVESRYLILSGIVEARKIQGGREVVSIHNAGEVIIQSPGVPILTKAIEDAVMVEYKPNSKSESITTTDYEPYEQMIENQGKAT